MHDMAFPQTCIQAHGHGAVLLNYAPDAQLAVRVVAPTPNNTVARKSTQVIVACCDCYYRDEGACEGNMV